MSEEKKSEILGRENELDEGELEAVAGAAKGGYADKGKETCVVLGEGKSPCVAFGEGKPHPCACFEAGNSGDWKP